MSGVSDKLKLLADPTRYRIVEFLAEPIRSCCSREDGVCGCDLETYLGLTQPTISHHMKQLVDSGLVTAERRGRWVFYEIGPSGFQEIADALMVFAEAGERASTLRVPA
ncbi:MAG: metalloregulator ArsR/SmtB family transcription factor [Trueperaceae bacterium]